MRFMLFVAVLAVSLGMARADDVPAEKKAGDRDRAAKAALALAAANDPDKCECAKSRVLDWSAASAKGLKAHMPVVVFAAGTEVRCCAGALPAKIDKLPAGFKADRPIVVYRPDALGTGWTVVAELPADASREKILEAIKKATPPKQP